MSNLPRRGFSSPGFEQGQTSKYDAFMSAVADAYESATVEGVGDDGGCVPLPKAEAAALIAKAIVAAGFVVKRKD